MRRLRTRSCEVWPGSVREQPLCSVALGTAAALGVVSGLSLFAGLLVDACKCAQGTRTLVLLRRGRHHLAPLRH